MSFAALARLLAHPNVAKGGRVASGLGLAAALGQTEPAQVVTETLGGIALGNQMQGMTPGLPGPLGTVPSLAAGVAQLPIDLARGQNPLANARTRMTSAPETGENVWAELLAEIAFNPANLVFGGVPGAARLPGRAGQVAGQLENASRFYTDPMLELFQAGKGAVREGVNRVSSSIPKVADLLSPDLNNLLGHERERVLNLAKPIRALFPETDPLEALALMYAETPAKRTLPEHLKELLPDLDELEKARWAELQKAFRQQGRLESQDLLKSFNRANKTQFKTRDEMLGHIASQHLGEDWSGLGPEMARLYPRLQLDLEDLQQILRINPYIDQSDSLDQAIATLQKRVDRGIESPEHLEKLQGLRKKWGVDLLTTPTNDALLSRYLRQYAGEVSGKGLDELEAENPGLGKMWGNLLGLWRQFQTSFPSQVVQDFSDMSSRSMFFGQGPGIQGEMLVKELQDRFPKLQRVIPQSLKDKLSGTRYGQAVESRLKLHGLLDLPAEVAQRMLSTVESPRGNSLGSSEPWGLEKRFRYVSAVSDLRDAVAHSGRTASFFVGMEQAARQAAPEVRDRLQTVIQSMAPESDPGKFLDWVQSGLETNGGLAPDKFYKATGRLKGLTPEHRQILLQEFQNYRQQFYQAGLENVKHKHFDQYATTNLDSALKNVLGFHFWNTRNIPLYLELMVQNPRLALAVQKYHQATDEYRKEQGLSNQPRYRSSIPLLDTPLDELLFGRSGQIFLNPERFIAGIEPLLNEPKYAQGKTGIGHLATMIEPLGLRPVPPIEGLLEILGVHGATQPAPILRTTPLINAGIGQLTGQQVDVEGPINFLRRQRLFGPAPKTPTQLIEYRLREMAYEQTGDPNAYDDEFAQGPLSPLYMEAIKSLSSDQVRTRMMGLLGIPVQFDSESAQELRQTA